MASACFWIIGSVLALLERLSAVRTPMTATLTTTMKTMSSRSVTPRACRRSVIHIARFGRHDDQAHRVVGVGACQREGGGGGRAAEAVEAEAAGRRKRDAARCGLRLQLVRRVRRMRHVSGGQRIAIVARDGAYL